MMVLSHARLRVAHIGVSLRSPQLGRAGRSGGSLLHYRGVATTKLAAATTERIEESTNSWCDKWKQLVEWEQAADTAASQSRIAHWSKKRLRAEGHMMVRTRGADTSRMCKLEH